MKYAADRPYAKPEAAARKIVELAYAVEPVQGRIHVEKINGPFIYQLRGSPAEYSARHAAGARPRLADDARIRNLRHHDADRQGPVRLASDSHFWRPPLSLAHVA